MNLLHRISKEIVEEVPPEIALCEFDCPKTRCSFKEWETCPRRLRKPAKKNDAACPRCLGRSHA